MSVFPSRATSPAPGRSPAGSPPAGTGTRTPPPRHRGSRLLRRLLEGKHRWGELEIWSSRYGYTGYCLVVYPPGSTAADRVRFRVMRSWPPLGLLLAVFTLLDTGRALPLPIAVALAAAVYLAGAVLVARIAGRDRRLVRTLQTCRGDEGTDALDRGPQALLDALAELLLDAERRLAAGETDAAGFEATWGRAWQVLGSEVRHGR